MVGAWVGRRLRWFESGTRLEYAWVAFAILNLAAMLTIIELRFGQGWETVPFHFIYVSLHDPVRLPGLARAGDPVGDPVRHRQHGRGDGVRHLPQLGGAARVHRGAADVADVPRHGLPRPPAPAGAGGRRGACRRARARPRAQVGVPLGRLARAPDADHDRSRPPRAPAARAPAPAPTRSPRRAMSCWASSAGWSASSTGCCCSSPPARPRRGRSSASTLAEVVTEVFQRWRGTAEREWILADVPCGTVAADRDQLMLALDALVENAIQHTRPGQQIEIGATADAGALRIRVRDGGRRDPRGRPGPGVRPLLPRGRRPQPPRRRRRARARDREGDRRGPRRQRRRCAAAWARGARSSCASRACAQQGTSR